MKTLLVTTPRANIAADEVRKLVPNDLTGWKIEALASGSLDQTASTPDVTLVRLNDDTRPADLKGMMPGLVRLQTKSGKRSYVVFLFKAKGKSTLHAAQMQSRLLSFAKQINRRLGSFPNPDRVNMMFEGSFEVATALTHIRAKLDLPEETLDMETARRRPRASALDQITAVVKSVDDLRAANGKLSADPVATAFGISLSQLAVWLGRSRQSLHKTPDAGSLQDALAFFERVARLRAVVPKDGFKKWLRIKNPDLDDKTPLDLLASGEWQVVADLADDMLTGAPP